MKSKIDVNPSSTLSFILKYYRSHKIITFLLISGRFPTNGHGGGPGIPNFLKVEKGATAYLESHTNIQHEKPIFFLMQWRYYSNMKQTVEECTEKSGDSVKTWKKHKLFFFSKHLNCPGCGIQNPESWNLIGLLADLARNLRFRFTLNSAVGCVNIKVKADKYESHERESKFYNPEAN